MIENAWVLFITLSCSGLIGIMIGLVFVVQQLKRIADSLENLNVNVKR